MGVGVDFALEQLFGTGHGQRGHLLAQIFTGTVGGGVDFSLGQFLLTGGFGDRFVTGSINDLVGTRVGLIDDLVGLGACFLQRFVDLLLRLGQIFLAAVGSSEAFSNLLLALFDRVHQRRPDLGRDDPDQTSEGQRLRKKGEIDIHG